MSHQNAGNPAQVYPYGIINHHNKPEEHPDTLPREYQPPGVDQEKEPQSLEEALMM